MSSFTASSKASGSAETSTTPAYKVTSSATATATSNLSQSDAQEEANNTAQQVANSVAQNDANIISQTLNLSPAGVIGQYSFLNLSFAFKVPINGNGEFTGLIKESVVDELSAYSKALNITSNKIVYNSTTFQPIPDTVQLTTLSSTVYNYGGIYGSKIINGQLFSSPTAKSLIENNRISNISIPITINNVSYIYKIKINTNIRFFVSEPITDFTQTSDLNNQINGIKINSKTLDSVHVINETDNTITTFTGISMSEIFTYDRVWNIITLNFTNAFASLVTQNIYPFVINPA
jgi:hypothetical protein